MTIFNDIDTRPRVRSCLSEIHRQAEFALGSKTHVWQIDEDFELSTHMTAGGERRTIVDHVRRRSVDILLREHNSEKGADVRRKIIRGKFPRFSRNID